MSLELEYEMLGTELWLGLWPNAHEKNINNKSNCGHENLCYVI